MNLENLKHSGLNIFEATKVSNLPCDILDIFHAQNIAYTDEDTLCIIASGGKALWEHLNHPLDKTLHPIDNLGMAEIKKLDPFAQILFPHPQWNIPLQRLGRFLNISRKSLLGLDINKEFGLWFAFRGAFLTKIKNIKKINYEDFNSPCETCEERPCINACPSNAIKEGLEKDFKLNLCAEYRLKKDSSCADRCLSRLICPYQNQHQYKLEQIQYHMSVLGDSVT